LKTDRKQMMRTSLNVLAAAAALTFSAADPAWALGLGRVNIQSALGEALRAEVEVTSISAEEESGLRVRVAPPESYKVAGVDYNPVLPSTTIQLQKRADGSNFLLITSDRVVQEPFVDVILEMAWSTGRLMREYTLLFDPPVNVAQKPAVAEVPAAALPVAPVVVSDSPLTVPVDTLQVPTSEPASAPDAGLQVPVPIPQQPASESVRQPVPVEPVPATPVKVRVESAEVAKSDGSSRGSVPATSSASITVKKGDTLTAIANRNALSGVSLEQMLVGLFRGNPPAFIGSNMNRLKSGVVLTLPGKDQVVSIDQAEARQLIHAQSADFNAYRQRLAAAIPAAAESASAPNRQSVGKVETKVVDRSAPPEAPKSTLKLDKGSTVAGKGAQTPSPEDKFAANRNERELKERAAQTQKSNDDLARIAAASAQIKASSVAASSATVGVAAASAAASQAPTLGLVTPTPQFASSGSAASSPLVSAASSGAASGVASGVLATASAPGVAASQRKAPVAAPVPAEEGSILDGLTDNPLVLPGAGLVLALLAGLGYYRLRNRGKDEAGVSSFLESRLQPDSFFGASGGQRVDTRDTGQSPSSMSYSLSQIDAIGDVDPVAEADVYLAYGRDLQAEEILKEALRANPDRLAIRSKLLEVYAKRRDVKGFESMAGEMFGLTDGRGEDWAKVQELGRSIDPENPLYEPGGHPVGGTGGVGMSEPLGATTMPQSVVPSASRFERSGAISQSAQSQDHDSLVDLDISVPGEMETPDDHLYRAPSMGGMSDGAGRSAGGGSIDFDPADFGLPESSNHQMGGASSRGVDLKGADFGSVSLDFDVPSSGSVPSGDADSDPWLRKIELADEFRQIGDVEGARDLLTEVVQNGSPALKAKAQRLLQSLN
jgi:pilus assembly protein FimV